MTLSTNRSMDPAAVLEAAALSEQKPMLAALAQGESELQRFYKHSVVLLTGASGFLGKQLAEKLLRSCDILKLYVLLRPKKGVNIVKRIEEITMDSAFDTLREQKPNFSDKIKVIEGDISELRLGIKDHDWKILTEEVTIIFHLAATTKFNEPLQTATFTNVRGAREILHLGKACKKLISFVHVSTAYSSATTELVGADVQEGFYRTPVTPGTVIRMAETMDTHRLNDITPEFIKGWPNTYTFTKAIAEQQVRLLSEDLPVCIVRPAIVLNSYNEPTPGWVDKGCIFGPVGLFLGFGLGVIHTALADNEVTIGFIPCDYVNNAILAAAREAATSQLKGGDHTKIYTVCTTHRNPVTFAKAITIVDEDCRNIISPKAFYYCFLNVTKNKYWYALTVYFWQTIPANIADFVCVLLGINRRFVKLNNKCIEAFNTMSFFGLNQWNFVDNNVEKLYNSLTKQDQDIFNFDVTSIDWTNMCLRVAIGIRKHIYKDGLKGTEYARKKQMFLRIFHYIVMALYGFVIWKLMHLMYFLANTILGKSY